MIDLNTMKILRLSEYTGMSFKEITEVIKMSEIKKLYPMLHEASEFKFVDTINAIARRKHSETKLRALRKIYGYTQKELSIRSGINLRIIQEYDDREMDINKASGSTLLALSKVLGCHIEDLLEYDFGQVE